MAVIYFRRTNECLFLPRASQALPESKSLSGVSWFITLLEPPRLVSMLRELNGDHLFEWSINVLDYFFLQGRL